MGNFLDSGSGLSDPKAPSFRSGLRCEKDHNKRLTEKKMRITN